MQRLNILVWQIHGSYLNTLVQSPHRFYLPVKPGRPEGYGGRGPTFPWSPDTVEVPAQRVRELELDLVIYQTPKNYFEDAPEILSPEQQRLPAIYLEHNTPQGRINEMVHPVDDPDVLLVHVTHFNDLFWDTRRTPTKVIEHAVIPTFGGYSGELKKGICLVNDMPRRARVVGRDIFEHVRRQVPLDLFGFNSLELGGMGDLPQPEVHQQMRQYRFFFNPVRYTSLPLSVLEAMEMGLPVVALATTELPAVIRNGVNGFIDTNVENLVEAMHFLLENPEEARRIGAEGRRTVRERFGLERFVRDWNAAFGVVTGAREGVPCGSQ